MTLFRVDQIIYSGKIYVIITYHDQQDCEFHSTNSVQVNGITYKTKAVVALTPSTDFEEPGFGQIQEIYIAGSSVYLYVEELDTEEFNEHYCMYVTSATQTFKLVNLQSTASYLPLSPYKIAAFPSALCIIPKFIIV